MIFLKPMSDFDFSQFMDSSIDSYAEEKVKAGNWKENEALEKSKQEFDKLLPKGHHTADHLLFSIVDAENNSKVGSLWVHCKVEAMEAFIYEFAVDEDQQGKGYGTRAIRELEQILQEQGIEGLSLHVFGHNKKAIRLYERLGFETTNMNMKKTLSTLG
ncbi:GNAT family N-acetyltransferase [Pseudalkalibacillus hwajinpoensis]|uniref:GNAT family N-acetyltransferase n=1 Tax=Guptibacillus hwajinpoensis TaxID=208199 RepID=A0A4U1MKT2_9BACL|nr:GNAT family N-acetyltransferase [Pseudalkalibacillus hwajinpoensis]TKD72049.1 GNAT family N-acetyltransferase [Pseudalkalibacillus hwajinpoensis]